MLSVDVLGLSETAHHAQEYVMDTLVGGKNGIEFLSILF